MQRGHHLLFLTFFAFLSEFISSWTGRLRLLFPQLCKGQARTRGAMGRGSSGLPTHQAPNPPHAARKRLSEFSLKKQQQKNSFM